ncbi:MAG: hypothetical protein ACOVSV_05745 [Fimbriimonadaceae bacterium]
MATLTLNASITPSRQVTVTYGTGGALTGSVALLIDNTITAGMDVDKMIAALVRSYHRQSSKVTAVSGIATSGTTAE